MSAPARVLVLDDDETIRAVVRRLAEIAGAEVTEPESGEDALRALYDARPDVVVLDLVGAREKEELRLSAGHAGLVAGRKAQKVTLPGIAGWFKEHSDADS